MLSIGCAFDNLKDGFFVTNRETSSCCHGKHLTKTAVYTQQNDFSFSLILFLCLCPSTSINNLARSLKLKIKVSSCINEFSCFRFQHLCFGAVVGRRRHFCC